MDARIGGRRQDDDGSSPASLPESPTQFGSLSEISKATSNTNSSHRKSSKAAQKRVVSIPTRDSEGTCFKGEGVTPPSDSWAWRKYGQKPIKGSPYPRGYYRCSSSKGCPARKQVDRSRDDPTMLVVTYSCEHNHPNPAPRNNHRGHINQKEEKPENSNGHSSPDPNPDEKGTEFLPKGSGSGSATPDMDEFSWNGHSSPDPDPDEKSTEFLPKGSGSGSGSAAPDMDEFSWFIDVRTTSTTALESPIIGEDYYHHHHRSDIKNVTKSSIGDMDVAMFFPMREEDESLFSDLGELPECAVFFRHGDNNNNNNNGVTQIC